MLLNINNLSSFAESYSSGYRRRAKKRSSFYESVSANLTSKSFDNSYREFQLKSAIQQIASGESIGSSIKGFFSKIWKMIKKFFEWMNKHLTNFFKWIKKIFTDDGRRDASTASKSKDPTTRATGDLANDAINAGKRKGKSNKLNRKAIEILEATEEQKADFEAWKNQGKKKSNPEVKARIEELDKLFPILSEKAKSITEHETAVFNAITDAEEQWSNQWFSKKGDGGALMQDLLEKHGSDVINAESKEYNDTYQRIVSILSEFKNKAVVAHCQIKALVPSLNNLEDCFKYTNKIGNKLTELEQTISTNTSFVQNRKVINDLKALLQTYATIKRTMAANTGELKFKYDSAIKTLKTEVRYRLNGRKYKNGVKGVSKSAAMDMNNAGSDLTGIGKLARQFGDRDRDYTWTEMDNVKAKNKLTGKGNGND